jgi:hypothetical protein
MYVPDAETTHHENQRHLWGRTSVSDISDCYVPKLQTGPAAVFPAMVFDTIFQ